MAHPWPMTTTTTTTAPAETPLDDSLAPAETPLDDDDSASPCLAMADDDDDDSASPCQSWPILANPGHCRAYQTGQPF